MRMLPSFRSRGAPAAPRATLRPMRTGLARMVASLRGAVAAAALIAAVVGAVPPVSLVWLVPALALVCAWTPAYVMVAWTRGLRPWLLGVDLCVSAALALAVGHLVPAAAIAGTTSWVAVITSMTVVSAQLGGAPAVSVPAGLLVVACYAAGQRLAHSPDGGLTALPIMVVQTLAGAAVMVVAMRIERTAVGAFRRLQEAEASAALARARREDERAQLRMVHNGPLTTLTMALHTADAGAGDAGAGDASAGEAGAGRAGAYRSTATLRHRAAAVLAALPEIAAVPAAVPVGVPGAGDGARVRLEERLSQVVVWYSPPLRISADLHPVSVPAAVAEAITGAVSEALENTVRYAATDRVTVKLREDAGAVRVTVTDAGRGFDLAEISPSGRGFGVREDLVGRMASVDGAATLRSSPGAGTAVELEWRRG